MIKRLITYDHHTNLLMLDHLSRTKDDKAEYMKHLSHIIWAHRIWLNRINNTPEEIDQWEIISAEKIRSYSEQHLTSFQDILNTDNLDRIIQYTNSTQRSFSHTISEILHHVVIHGQHHRAQISLLLRKNGIIPPASDLIYNLP